MVDADSPAVTTRAASDVIDAVRALVVPLLPGVVDLDPDANLLDLGLESLSIMRVVNGCRRLGARVRFKELAEQPTLRHWATLVADHGGGEVAAGAVAPARPSEPVGPRPLAPMQQAYWVGRLPGQPLGGVSAHYYAEFDGPALEPARLERAVRAVIERHPLLRTRFTSGTQEILTRSPWRGLVVNDLTDLPTDQVARELEATRVRESHRSFEVDRGEVLDVSLTLMPGGTSRLHLGIDMLAADAQSYQIVLDDVSRLYRDQSLPPLQITFADLLAGPTVDPEKLSEAQGYWRGRLGSLPEGPGLPVREDHDGRHRGVDRFHHELDAAEYHLLQDRARRHGLTTTAALACAFAEVVGRWCRDPTFLLNVPTFHRPAVPHADAVVGDFTSLTLLQVDVSGTSTFSARACSIQDQLRSDLAHDSWTGVEVLRELARLQPSKWLRAPVVFTSVLGMGPLVSQQVSDVLGEPGWMSSETPQVILDHQLLESSAGGLLVNWDVASQVFCAGVAEELVAAHRRALTWLLETADWSVELPVPLPPDQRRARDRANDSGAAAPAQRLEHAFFDHARAHPARSAVIGSHGDDLSYGDLADAALRVAAHLREAGVGVGDLVGIRLPKGPAQAVAVLGALAAGSGYVPVGVDQPPARAAHILADAGARLLLVDDEDAVSWRVPTLRPADCRQLPPADPTAPDPAAVAYIIYTSGSTGRPKGVAITHQAAWNTVAAVNTRFDLSAGDRVLALSSLDFDLSVYDLFGPLSVGGALVMPAESDRREPARWAQLIERHRVTVWNSVPALLDMLLTVEPVGEESLRVVLVSGDWVRPELAIRGRERWPSARFSALGGATEASIWSNVCDVAAPDPDGRSIPYGFPLPGQRLRVVDDAGRDRPCWVPGELCIGGAGVAAGYHRDPARTATAFPWWDGERWYRTGDRARYLPDGMVEILGRTDQQVKIRGHRIELNEVAAVLRSHPDVQHAVAVLADPGRLLAAVQVRRPTLTEAELRRFAADLLPGYMVPERVAVAETLPLSRNGKVDPGMVEASLPERSVGCADESVDPELEAELAAVWGELLRIPSPSRQVTFFDLGGDSLRATQLTEALRRRFGVTFSLADVYDASTVAEQAALLSRRRGDDVEEGAI